jgi:aldose 1-epimerase
MSIEITPFGTAKSGTDVHVFTLTNSNGMTVRLSDYGCTVLSVEVPDINGRPVNTVLGYKDLHSYEQGGNFFGAFVGRYANRIKGACFDLDGKTYRLSKNDGENHLHGIFPGIVFSHAEDPDENEVKFTYISAPFDEGYPGTLRVRVRYQLTDLNELIIRYRAETDSPTVLNFTNHSYFNLNGTGDILSHTLYLSCPWYLEKGPDLCPTGKIKIAEFTPLDFTVPKEIGRDLHKVRGYDDCLVFEDEKRKGYLIGDISGIRMDIETTQPGIQLYTANFLDPPFTAVCLETQHFPCSPNIPDFPSTVLLPGEKFREKTVYRFSTVKR